MDMALAPGGTADRIRVIEELPKLYPKSGQNSASQHHWAQFSYYLRFRSRFPIEKESVGMTTQNDLQAHIVTGRGTIHLRLFPEQAPLTVASFVNLALRKYYDGLTFHRVIPEFMIQGGCPEGSGRGGPGYRFEDEIVALLTGYPRRAAKIQ